MSTLTAQQRDALPASDFGDPEKRLFPILDASDVAAASHLIGRAKGIDVEAVKKRIIAICKRKNLKPPDAWMQPAAMSATDEGDYVEREGLIFEAGDYEDQGISVTPEDLLAIEADFQPVNLELEHYDTKGTPNILSGKLGQLVAAHVGPDDPTKLYGTTRIPRWLHDLNQGQPIKPSVVLRHSDKGLERVGLVRNPQVSTAALFSAYAQFAGARHSASDQADLQKIHDIAVGQGAMCDPKNTPAQMSAPSKPQQEKKKMTLKERWNTFINGKTEEDLAAITPEQLAEFAKADPPTPTPPTQQPNAEVEALKAQLAAQATQVAQFAADKRTSTATQKVDGLINAGKLYPSERPYALAAFTLALEDDERDNRLVTFAASDGTEVKATRVQTLEAQYQARPAHNLTKEQVAVFAIPAQDGSKAEAVAEKRRKELLEMTPIGQQVLHSTNGNGNNGAH